MRERIVDTITVNTIQISINHIVSMSAEIKIVSYNNSIGFSTFKDFTIQKIRKILNVSSGFKKRKVKGSKVFSKIKHLGCIIGNNNF